MLPQLGPPGAAPAGRASTDPQAASWAWVGLCAAPHAALSKAVVTCSGLRGPGCSGGSGILCLPTLPAREQGFLLQGGAAGSGELSAPLMPISLLAVPWPVVVMPL